MNTRYISKYLCLLALSTFLFSCQDSLNLNPQSAIGDAGFYSNSSEVEAGVIAIYDGLQDVPLREFALTEMRSDNTQTKSSEGDWAQFESFDVEPTNLAIVAYWRSNYNVIFRANRVLENLEVVEDANFRARFEGEARFARALAHFNLVRAFGDVPLIEKVIIQSDDEFFDRDPVMTVLMAIESDLALAASLLPQRGSIEDGRATSGAANGLLAKVKLTMGKYGEAEGILANLLSDPNYALMSEYFDVFYSEQNSEIIFAIPYTDDDANESQDFSFEMTLGGVVSGLNFITPDFASNLDPADEERKAALVNPLNSQEVGKFITQSADARLCGNDWIVLRLADVYLMYSEAIMAGETSTQSIEAINAYNAVRDRSGLDMLPTDGTGVLTRTRLLDERRVELAFENHRFYDLVRFGVAEEVLGAFAATEGYSFAPTDLVLPIPQAEINVSQGLLVQNPGYQ